ncbi:hypothetical protein PAM7971_03533 [Pacificibacter marinus]|uniref:Uncharacterized protein n=1 Tax=Pacificibacter marinus TaxID=658057 RepID=A0A1Y5TSF3_9RHOB|nr:hypothetical protein PAM7971_03533 [Pacificibacter marinus]
MIAQIDGIVWAEDGVNLIMRKQKALRLPR